MRNLLIIKSENFSPEQLQLLQKKGIATTHLSLLQFDYNNITVNHEYDYILFNSPNGAEAYLRTKHNNKKFMVVGQKTKEKLLNSLILEEIMTFNNQQELTNNLLQKDKLSLLYVVGNLSEIPEDLIKKHNVTIIEGYKTVPITQQLNTDFSCYDYIVYYSNSNYMQFKQFEKTLNPQTLHIFIGQKCSAGHTEQNFKILATPTFESLYELM